MGMSDQDKACGISIRGASPADYEAIRRLWLECDLPFRPGIRDAEEGFCRQLERFGDLYLVAHDGNAIVGVILGTHDVRKGWINRLAVSPCYRRRGIAEALIRSCETALRGHGIEIVAALIEESNGVSCKLFEKMGYLDDVPVRYYRKLSYPGA